MTQIPIVLQLEPRQFLLEEFSVKLVLNIKGQKILYLTLKAIP